MLRRQIECACDGTFFCGLDKVLTLCTQVGLLDRHPIGHLVGEQCPNARGDDRATCNRCTYLRKKAKRVHGQTIPEWMKVNGSLTMEQMKEAALASLGREITRSGSETTCDASGIIDPITPARAQRATRTSSTFADGASPGQLSPAPAARSGSETTCDASGIIDPITRPARAQRATRASSTFADVTIPGHFSHAPAARSESETTCEASGGIFDPVPSVRAQRATRASSAFADGASPGHFSSAPAARSGSETTCEASGISDPVTPARARRATGRTRRSSSTSCQCQGYSGDGSVACWNRSPHEERKCSGRALIPAVADDDTGGTGDRTTPLLVCEGCAENVSTCSGIIFDVLGERLGTWSLDDEMGDLMRELDAEKRLLLYARERVKMLQRFENNPKLAESEHGKNIIAQLSFVTITSMRFQAHLRTLKPNSVVDEELALNHGGRGVDPTLYEDMKRIVELLHEGGQENSRIGKSITELHPLWKGWVSWELENVSFLISLPGSRLGKKEQYDHIDLPGPLVQFAVMISRSSRPTHVSLARYDVESSEFLRRVGNLELVGRGSARSNFVLPYADFLLSRKTIESNKIFVAPRRLPAGARCATLGGSIHHGPRGVNRVVMFANTKFYMMSERTFKDYDENQQYNAVTFMIEALSAKLQEWLDDGFQFIGPSAMPLELLDWYHEATWIAVQWHDTFSGHFTPSPVAPNLGKWMRGNQKRLKMVSSTSGMSKSKLLESEPQLVTQILSMLFKDTAPVASRKGRQCDERHNDGPPRKRYQLTTDS